MKITKILSVLIMSIILALSLVSCNIEYTPANAQKYQYNYYPGTDWGMTRAECLKALHLEEKDVTDGILEEFIGTDATGFSIKKDMFGYPATIYFCFYSKKVSETKEMGLADIYAVYEGQYDAVKITNELVKELEKQKVAFTHDYPDLKKDQNSIYREYPSESTLQNLTDGALQEKTKKAFSMAYNNADISKYESKPLSLVTVRGPVEEKYCIYFAGYVPAIMNNIE